MGYQEVADRMRDHFLDIQDHWIEEGPLKALLRDIDDSFFALRGDRLIENEGVQEYMIFKQVGGTYSGAPIDYKPGDDFTSIQ